MFQTSLTVCSEGSTAFQAVRNITAGWKPALRTVKLKWPLLKHALAPLDSPDRRTYAVFGA